MKSSDITVVIPSYNRVNVVCRAIQSVLNQSSSCGEIIVVNDGSTDTTSEVVRSTFGDAVILVEKENGGVSSARNAGAERVKTEWIAFLDSDDYFLENNIARRVEVMNSIDDVDLLSCSYETANSPLGSNWYCGFSSDLLSECDAVSETIHRLQDPFYTCLKSCEQFSLSTVMMRLESFVRAGRFDTSFTIGEDNRLISLLSRFAKFAVCREKLVVLDMAKDSESLSIPKSVNWWLTAARNRHRILSDAFQYAVQIEDARSVARANDLIATNCKHGIAWAASIQDYPTVKEYARLALKHEKRPAWRCVYSTIAASPGIMSVFINWISKRRRDDFQNF